MSSGVAESRDRLINWMTTVPCRTVSVPATPVERVPWCRYFSRFGIYFRSFRGFTQFFQWHSGIVRQIRPWPPSASCFPVWYPLVILRLHVTDGIFEWTYKWDRFEAVLRIICYFDSVLTWLSSEGGQWEYVCLSEVCHPHCVFKLYGEVNSVKKHNYKIWLNDGVY